MNATLLQAAALIIPLVIAIVFHEVAHGWVALALGDPTAREQRRLTLNPLRHVDVVGTLLVPGSLALAGLPVFGWAKPVPVDKRRLRDPRKGMMAVAAAGPAMNLLLAAVGAILIGLMARLAPGEGGAVLAFAKLNLNYFVVINVFLALFNLLPVPPFDGSHIVEGVLPRKAARIYARLRPYGFALVFALLVVVPYIRPQWGVVGRLVMPPVGWALAQYDALATAVAGF